MKILNNIELTEKIITIILSLCLLINAYFLKKSAKTWLLPASIFSLVSFVFTFFPLVILFNTPVSLNSQSYMTLAVLLFSWTSFFFNWNKAYQLNLDKTPIKGLFDTKRLRNVLYGLIIISLTATVFHVKEQGIGIKDILRDPMFSAQTFSRLRYTLQIEHTVYNTISLSGAYLSVLIGGLIITSFRKTLSIILICMSFAPSLFIMFTQSAKGCFFLCIFFFLGGSYVAHHHSRLKLFTNKVFIKTITMGLISLILMIISFFSRDLGRDTNYDDVFYKVKQLMSYYTLSHIYAFSDWFKSFNGEITDIKYDISINNYGYYSFNSITRFFLDKNYIRGIYNEYYSFGEFVESNVYTIYRGLIMDFGIIGSLFFMLLNGFIINKIYFLFLTNKKPIFLSAFLIFTIAYMCTAFLASLLTWGVIPLTFVIFLLLLLMSKRD